LIDLEFLAQTLQLAAAHDTPSVIDANTVRAFRKLEKAGRLAPDEAETLIAAARLENDLQEVLRIAHDGTLDPAKATPGLCALLAHAGGAVDFRALEGQLFAAQSQVRALYETLMGAA
jgi:glutamate-ammonia-ligase adenylyltransferase